MATRTSYKTLVVPVGYLKWLPRIESNAIEGVTQDDLLEAEVWARDRINLWLVKMCGPKRGQEYITEFMDDSGDLDPAIVHLAEMIGSARISQIWEERNYSNQGLDSQRQRKTFQEIIADAMDLMRGIRSSGYLVRADGSLRRLRLGSLLQGPIVMGPMSRGSLYDDSGIFVDARGQSRTLPHIHPLDQGT